MIDKSDVKVVEEYFKKNAFNMIVEAYGKMKYPFIDPGQQYGGDLWDWDSYFSGVGMLEICEYFKNDPDFDYKTQKERLAKAMQGCVLNFLDAQLDDGFIPIVINDRMLNTTRWIEVHDESNQHKPFLCQSALSASKALGDYDWVDVEKLVKYIEYYRVHQFHDRSGLYVWKSDWMIGMDNNPSVFGFPGRSVGDIYLNTFMYLELLALIEFLIKKGDKRAEEYQKEAQRLKETIKKECYDVRDGFYYSVFVDLAREHKEGMHTGLPLFWNSVPIKVRFAGCFLPMYAGISDQEQNRVMIERHYLDDKFLSPNGMRSTAEDERMYCLEGSSNPSNNLGPIWILHNYIPFMGLLNAGRDDLAKDLCERLVKILARDIKKTGKVSECYHPMTGEPVIGLNFLSWNCLIIKMIKEAGL